MDIASIIHKFLGELSVNGYGVPTEMQFRKKDYERAFLAAASKCTYSSVGRGITGIEFVHGNDSVRISRAKCSACGE